MKIKGFYLLDVLTALLIVMVATLGCVRALTVTAKARADLQVHRTATEILSYVASQDPSYLAQEGPRFFNAAGMPCEDESVFRLDLEVRVEEGLVVYEAHLSGMAPGGEAREWTVERLELDYDEE